METFIPLISALLLAGIPALVTLITHRRNQQTLRNGLRTVVAEIHTDMQLTVLPALADLREWRNGYKGTVWSDKQAIEAWLTSLAEQLGSMEVAIAKVREEIAAHVAWEEGTEGKYSELLYRIDVIEEEILGA